MKRMNVLHLPNRPRMLGELRPEFEIRHGAWMLDHPCGEPTLDAPESIPRGSSSAFISNETSTLLIVGHISRDGWAPRQVAQ